jgi:hypothetical protein
MTRRNPTIGLRVVLRGWESAAVALGHMESRWRAIATTAQIEDRRREEYARLSRQAGRAATELGRLTVLVRELNGDQPPLSAWVQSRLPSNSPQSRTEAQPETTGALDE